MGAPTMRVHCRLDELLAERGMTLAALSEQIDITPVNLSVLKNDRVYIVSESGDIARVTITDVNQSNGVIHVVNKVLLPK